MADVFVSYASAEKDKARLVAESLEAAGFTVWWDRALKPGETFDRVIEREITAAKAVVVIWTRASVDSQWVREEADHGRQRECLVPLLMDEVTPPMGFGRVQAARLAHWTGDPADAEWQEVVHSVQAIVGRPARPLAQRRRAAARPGGAKRPPWLAIGLGVVAVGLLGLVMLLSEAVKVMSNPAAQQQIQALQEAAQTAADAADDGALDSAPVDPSPQAVPAPAEAMPTAEIPQALAAPPQSAGAGDPYAAALAAINPLAGQLQLTARANGLTYICVTGQGWCPMDQPGYPGNSCWCPSGYGPVQGMTQ